MVVQTITRKNFESLHHTLTLHLTQLVDELKQLSRRRTDPYLDQFNYIVTRDQQQIAALILSDPVHGGVNLTLFLSPKGNLQLSIMDDDLVSFAYLDLTTYAYSAPPILTTIPDVPVWNDIVLPALQQALQPCLCETFTP